MSYDNLESQTPKLYEYVFSLDTERVGLYGEDFAVGVSVLNKKGVEVDSLFLYCTSEAAYGLEDNRDWIRENVLPTLGSPNCETLLELRTKFWNFYMDCKRKYVGIIFVAACGAPCESGFFTACVRDSTEDRQWDGPYPLHELGTLLLMRGKDPKADYERLENELPKHNPLCDARQSGRLWIEHFPKVNTEKLHDKHACVLKCTECDKFEKEDKFICYKCHENYHDYRSD